MILDVVLTPQDLDDLDGVARQAFEYLVELTPIATDRNSESDESSFLAQVTYSGEASGAMLIGFDEPFAFAFTQRLMQVSSTDFNDDVADALGELANTIGGNYKGLLPSDTLLSMPRVVEGEHRTVLGVDWEPLGSITYAFDIGCCRVTVLGLRT